MLQKATLVGLLGFIFPGVCAHDRLYVQYDERMATTSCLRLLVRVRACALCVSATGKILQSAVGLLISSVFLLAFTSRMPYTDQRTNTLAIIAQSIQAFSYFSTILLKVDMNGEVSR